MSSLEKYLFRSFSSVQLLSCVWLFVTPWTATCQAITNSQSPPKLMPIESVMPSNHFILCRPLFLLPSIFPSIRVFPKESVLHIRWPKYWSFSFNHCPSKEHPGLISFRMDWLDLLAVQGTLKSLLQHLSSKASILLSSAFFSVQLSHPYMTTGKTIALTRRTFVGKVMSLLFNMLSRFVIAFLPRSKQLLISTELNRTNEQRLNNWSGDSSVQFITQSCLTLCNRMVQHTRPPCRSPAPGIYSNSCPLRRWCYPIISSSDEMGLQVTIDSVVEGFRWWYS